MCYRNFDWKLKYDSLLLLVRCGEEGIPIGYSGPGAGRHAVWLDEPVEEKQGDRGRGRGGREEEGGGYDYH